ncbi:MAG TPA: 2-amino-4-hydroxy-6-hydroxymethyldihydropteridine diphosphokinase, partial [Eggerthellaceae bacterium]|nr:2-amino-4-hydroxy-6-hydroxymethyldihydropteridine diphosphokinase [Eggerthellaceae bacterium]
FARLGYPVMCAVSRKGFIGWAYHIDQASQRDEASAAEALMACELGATVVRTHNVAATVRALRDLRPLVVVALGCNVALVAGQGEEREAKIAQMNQAISQLCTLPDSQIVDISSFYASEPAYYEDQDEFVNAIALVRCGVPPLELLDYLHAVENGLGRVRHFENGPRTCDLDIVDYQMYTADTEVLTLPHPRALERYFVVEPLAELRPNFVFADGTSLADAHPEYGKAVRIS